MKRIGLYILSLVSILLISCSNEDQIGGIPDPNPSTKNEITLEIQIPGARIPSTYGMTTVQEDQVNELTILAIKDYSGQKKLENKIVAAASDISNTTGGKMTVKVRIPLGSYDCLVVIANANDKLTSLVEGTSTLANIEALEYSHADGSWDTTTPAYIPMSGKLQATTTNGFQLGTGITLKGLKLIRMLAAINIKNDAHTSFALKKVHLFNMNKNGKIVSNNLYISNPARPYLPTTPEIVATAITFDYDALAVGNEMLNEMYTFEAAANANMNNVHLFPRIIVEGILLNDGLTYFYPIDFTYDGTKPSTGKGAFMPIVRNHKYIFTISKVTGAGYPTANDALNTKVNFTNKPPLAAQALVVNDDFTDVYYNENTFLAVNSNPISLSEFAHTTASLGSKFDVLSNAYWTITCLDADGASAPAGNWLSVNPANGALNVKRSVSIVTSATAVARTGYLVVKTAGIVSNKIKVTQSLCGRSGTAQPQIIGNNSYLTHLYGTTCWMVENIKEGTKEAGTASANFYGDGAPIDPAWPAPANNEKYYSWEQAQRICPAGWSLPTDAQWNQLKAAVNSDLTGIGKWWTTPALAFKGCFFIGADWKQWGTYSQWWSSSAYGARYYADAGGIYGPYINPLHYMTVRCIQN